MKSIIVPIDFSDLAINVLEVAAKLALVFSSKVWLIHVITRQPYYIGLEMGSEIIEDLRSEEESRMDRDLKAMQEFLIEKGVDTASELLHGRIVPTILDFSEKHHADLIVMGSKNFGVFYRAFLGSVSEGVLRGASCPVMILPDQE